MTLTTRLIPLVALLSLPTSGQALELTDWLKLEGFGTLSMNRSDDPVATVRPDPRNNQGTRDGGRQWDGDSLLSAQFTLNPGGQWRAVWQVLAKDDLIDRYRPRTEWLYASWDANPALNVKLGRVVLPVFMMSDSRNVAYAQTSVRPPVIFYGLNPVTNMDGGALQWSTKLPAGDLSLDASYGKTQVTLQAGKLDLSAIAGLGARWSSGPLTLRLGYSDYKGSADAPATAAALASLSAGATGCVNCKTVLAERIPLSGVKANIIALGAVYEGDAWQVQAEYARRHTNTSLANEASGWYVQAAYRLGAWTPYLGYAVLKTHEARFGLVTAPGAPAQATSANAAFDQYLRFQADRKGMQLGVRWDFRDNMALKFQLEDFKTTADRVFGSSANVNFPAPPPVGKHTGAVYDGNARLISVNLDFVF